MSSSFQQTFVSLPLSIVNGGSGGTTTSEARTNLGLVSGGAGDIWVELTGDTMTGDLIVPDDAYGVGWNGNLEVPTKNAVYDKIEVLSSGATTSISRTFALMGS